MSGRRIATENSFHDSGVLGVRTRRPSLRSELSAAKWREPTP